ncbi:MAG: PQQ-dependent sugar dehydrogenase [Chloroflexia bacterium]
MKRVVLAALLCLSLVGSVRAQGTDPTPTPTGGPGPARKFDSTHVKLAEGYLIEPVVINLSVPTTAIFDGDDLLVAESGWAKTAPPRVLRIRPDGTSSVIASIGLVGPVTGLLVIDGELYISHKGKVSVLQADGSLKDIVTGLPSNGDHQNNNIVLGSDGKIYMGQGTVTNSGVVGEDSYIFGWLPEAPTALEIPCKDITLVGTNFESGNPLTESDDKATTGAYKPFGTPGSEGETITGDPKCGGSILRFNRDGSGLEVVAWGMRNPFGLEVDGSGQLWATYHGADVRGSRNIFNDPDYLVRVEEGAWYGWPEFFDGVAVTDPRFKDPTKPQPEFLWRDHPPVAKAFATFQSHAGINGLDFSPRGAFGFEGDAFVAMFGTFAPVTTGIDVRPAGFSVVRVDVDSAEVSTFAENVLPGPAYINQQLGMNRPSDLVFAPDSSLYVVDWGASTITDEGLKLQPLTGAVWRIYREDMPRARPQGAVQVVAAPQIPEEERKPEVLNVPEAWGMISGPVGLLCGIGLLAIIALFLVWRVLRGRSKKAE